MRRTVMKGLLGLGATAAAGRAAWAQPFPSKQIRLIVGFPPGGGLDNLARLLSERMAQDLGQSLLIDNRPGAGGGIASAELLRAPADGHTIVLGNVGQFSVLEHLSPNPIAGFPSRVAAIGQIGNAPLGLFVPASLPVTDLRGFIAYVKAGGGKYNYGSGGSGQITHLAVEMLKQQAGLALTHVPYKGSAASVTDLIGGLRRFRLAGTGRTGGHPGRGRPPAQRQPERRVEEPRHRRPDVDARVPAGAGHARGVRRPDARRVHPLGKPDPGREDPGPVRRGTAMDPAVAGAVPPGRTVLLKSGTSAYTSQFWGRPGFDGGIEAAQGVSRTRTLVNPSGKLQTPTTSVSL